MAYTTGNRRPMRQQLQLEGGVETLVISATLQLTDRSANVLAISGGAADREVRMPASNRDGSIFRLVNGGATNNLLLKRSDGADIAATTKVLTPGQATWVVNEGGGIANWKHTGIETVVL